MRRFALLIGTLALLLAAPPASAQRGDQATLVVYQATPQQPATVACDDTGAVAFTANAKAVRLEIRNAGANTACITWGTAGAPDRTDTTTCSFELAARVADTDSTIYVSPSGIAGASLSFECDTNGANNLIVTEWRRP